MRRPVYSPQCVVHEFMAIPDAVGFVCEVVSSLSPPLRRQAHIWASSNLHVLHVGVILWGLRVPSTFWTLWVYWGQFGQNRTHVQLWDTAWILESVTEALVAITAERLFMALHAMQTRYSDEKSVCLSVCPSVRLSHACIVTKRKKDLSRFLHHTKDNLA